MLYTSLRDFLGSVTTNDRTPIDPVEIVVIDGDTIQLGGVTCRLLGFDAPETYHARCSHELVHGLKATNKLRRMINDGCSHALSITRHRDKYKRSLATLYLDGIDVAQVMTGPAMPPAPITTLPQLGPSSPPKLREWLMW